MEATGDVQALEKISSEVDESQIKVILSNQCIKAQAFLLDKLKKQSERHKETCGFISSANLKLEAEIKQAEQEIHSMLMAQETIKFGNVEIKKEWLVAKVRRTEVLERIEEGKTRYEALWLECKTRFEKIPFVQKLLRATEKAKALNNKIENLDKDIITLYEEIKTKREICNNLDKERCIELANFMVIEMPNTMKIIKEKLENVNDLTVKIEEIIKEQDISETAATEAAIESQPIIDSNQNNDNQTVKDDEFNKSDEDSLMPKLELANYDLDFMDVNLEGVKKDDVLNNISITSDSMYNFDKNKRYREEKPYEYIISPCFTSYKEHESQNYSKRKLINILEDIHINNNETYNIVKKVNPENLRTVNEISAVEFENAGDMQMFSKDKDTPIKSDTIEEVDMTCSNADNIIIPPTQFLDITLPSSQEGVTKKRVSFEIPSSLKINEIIEDADVDVDKQNADNDENEANQTINSQLDVSVASEDSFLKIQDMILKKHNLHLSPQFVYAKKPDLQKREDNDKIVTSKFFPTDNQQTNTDQNADNGMDIDAEPDNVQQYEEKITGHDILEDHNCKDIPKTMDIDAMITSSPTENKKHDEQPSGKPVSGLLFTHGTQAIPDSLNASLSTTGYEESDFPHCIDSSLLLSPKADEPMIPACDNPDVLSQDVPNFLSGFRKTGLSFFGGGNATTSEPNPDSSAPNDGNNFSFNFGGEKKNRGGLFSLFN